VSMLRNLRVPALAIAAEIVREAVVVVPAAVEAVVDVVGADATEAAEAVVAIVVADAADLVVAAGVATKRSSHKLQRPRQKSRPFSFYFFVLINLRTCHPELVRGTRRREGPYETCELSVQFAGLSCKDVTRFSECMPP
jgi:hypothetical protein